MRVLVVRSPIAPRQLLRKLCAVICGQRPMLASAALAIACLAAISCQREPALVTRAVHARQLALPSNDWAVRFPEAFPMQIAVLWTDPSVSGLGLIHSLREMGLPFFVTRSVSQAVAHRILIIYPMVNYRSMSIADAGRLCDYVRNGG